LNGIQTGREEGLFDRRKRTVFFLILVFLFIVGTDAAANEGRNRFGIEVEGGGSWFSENQVQIPGDSGTRFSLLDLTGRGPTAYFRMSGSWDLNPRHGIVVTLAPLQVKGTGMLPQTVRFTDKNFAPGVSTEGTYKFNTYRVTYGYTFLDHRDWRLRIGATGLVRDAKIELKQGNTSAQKENVGFAPLLHFDAQYRLSRSIALIAEFDGLVAPQGRLIDLAMKINHDLTDRWSLGVGYRMLEGGSDSDDVYNFAWLHFVFLSVGFKF
jgi:hypothetical protein